MSSSWYCRLCHARVCNESDIDESHQKNLSKHTMSHRSISGSSKCTSLFLAEPLEWMSAMDSVEGPLLCPGPKCRTRLGGWNWSGSQCSCGTWVTPSIFLVASRLDRKFDVVGLEKSASVLVESQPDEGDAVVTAAPLEIIDRSKAFAAKDLPELHTTTGTPEIEHDQKEILDVLGPRGPGRSACSIHWFVTNPPSAVVIFLHPEGESGQLAKTWVDTQWGGRLLTETSGTAFIFPDSGTSPASGAREWYHDGNSTDIDGLCQEIRTLVSQIVKKGTPAHRIIIGGLGSGGSAAVQSGIRLALSCEDTQIYLGGIFCIGGGTTDDSKLWSLLENTPAGTALPPMLLCHAKDDPEVPFVLGLSTASRIRSLLELEIEVEEEDVGGFGWFPYKGSRHDGGVRRLATWINLSLQNPRVVKLAFNECITPPIDEKSTLANLKIDSEHHDERATLSEDADAEVFNEIYDSISQEIDASISEAISNSISDALDEQRDAAMEYFMNGLPVEPKDAMDPRLFDQAALPEQPEPEQEVDDEIEEATHQHIAFTVGCLLGVSVVAFVVNTFIARKKASSSV